MFHKPKNIYINNAVIAEEPYRPFINGLSLSARIAVSGGRISRIESETQHAYF
jgi:hypothetical protein